ncbi:hypothetical protein IJF85_00695 [Candidatus Saccharibacteria bacterium]|nr:hypothetical protein [Candidatus Saccharibacteria bacterium]MBQ3263897.1 hypothetical protein [Candidatus Saccharibacteria bacterium]
MVRSTSHKINICKIAILAIALTFGIFALPVHAATVTSACATSPCSANSNFQVNINEFLSVSLGLPNSWASGSINQLLVNQVDLNVASNNSTGFIAYMTTETASTALTNLSPTSSDTIPTLTANRTASNFDNNRWGFSLDATNYQAVIGAGSTPSTILTNTGVGSATQPIYFGAKSDGTIDSGTYANTVVISVVTGVDTDPDEPVEPTNPVNPTDPANNGSNPYTDASGRTIATTTTTTGTTSSDRTTTRTDISQTYVAPAGVTTTNVAEGTPLATGLAVTAAVAATAGIIFFIVAKRRKDDEEEDIDDYYE